MNKPELIDKMTFKLGRLPRNEIENAFDAILELIAKALAQGERVEFRGFGSFNLKHMKARMSRNPKTGKPAPLAAKVKIHFKPGKEMRKGINEGMGTQS